MKEYILRDYEPFTEKHNGLLLVTKNSNLMYIKIGEECFIAREFVKSIVPNKDIVKYETSYYNVKDNNKVLELKIVRTNNGCFVVESNIKGSINITPLYKVLGLKVSESRYLDEHEVDILTGGKEPFYKRKYKTKER